MTAHRYTDKLLTLISYLTLQILEIPFFQCIVMSDFIQLDLGENTLEKERVSVWSNQIALDLNPIKYMYRIHFDDRLQRDQSLHCPSRAWILYTFWRVDQNPSKLYRKLYRISGKIDMQQSQLFEVTTHSI